METINSKNSTDQNAPEEIQVSPKELMNRIVQFKNVLLKSWKIIAIFAVIGAVIGFIVDLNLETRPTYTAYITFNLGGGSPSGPMGDLGGLASMFGLGSSAPEASIFVGENFLYYATSRPIITRALMTEVVVPKKGRFPAHKDLMVNYYIEESGIKDDEWEKDDTLRNIRYARGKKLAEFSSIEFRALGDVFTRIKGETTISQKDRKSSFLTLQAGLHSEMLAKTWVETLLETVQLDYTEKQTKKTREMLALMQDRAAGLEKVMFQNESSLAKYIDQNQQMVVAEGQLQQTKLTRKSAFLQQQYYSALQSVENLRLSLIKEAPLFTIIEPVSLPLYKELHEPYATQAGLILGLMLGLVIIFLRQAYLNIMN